MEFRGSQARPTRPQQTTQTISAATPPVAPHRSPGRKKWPLAAAVLVAVLIVGALAWHVLHAPIQPRSDRYQAVFLDNGQVFFGKLKNTEGRYLKLEGSYYTKKQDLPADATEEQKTAVSNNVSLVKVGDEVYGPENTLQIRAEQVLFWQDLTTDSKVAKAIDDAKE